jgi:hypothetical protein
LAPSATPIHHSAGFDRIFSRLGKEFEHQPDLLVAIPSQIQLSLTRAAQNFAPYCFPRIGHAAD